MFFSYPLMDLLVRHLWQPRGLSCAVRSLRQAFIFSFSPTTIPANVCQTHLLVGEPWAAKPASFCKFAKGKGSASSLKHRLHLWAARPGCHVDRWIIQNNRTGIVFSASSIFVDTEAIQTRASFSPQMTASDYLACEQPITHVGILAEISASHSACRPGGWTSCSI